MTVFTHNSFAKSDVSPKVLASIKPLALISNEITQGVTEADVLLNKTASPHDYVLKPSDMVKLKQADLVIWVGPVLEHFLNNTLTDASNSLALSAQPSIEFQHFTHEGQISIGDFEDGDGDLNPHIWLGPDQALQAATVIANRLSQIDPQHKEQYQTNLVKFKLNLQHTVDSIQQQLASVRDQGYFVFHDGYDYFENKFGLDNLGYFTVDPERKPGAKTVAKIHQALLSHKAVCVFSEPQFTPAIVTTVIQGTPAKHGEVDPLGSDIKIEPGAYFNFLTSVATGFKSCLQQG
ncbi:MULTISPECIES: zinc ABC transporter substrate-binding protein ZnuA [Vibrio]|uniref:zinc ABC transporter substrate-binding protein ZnuA n=1 Tax=Vibrio TaxID=662 RepID=UPI001E415516|nr:MULTISPECIES: zinc ABC transporter substrate-binding protein ZnuA [Vibrio]